MSVVKVYPKAEQLKQAVDDLKTINDMDIKYLLANRELSFMDESTLQMIEKKSLKLFRI
ncbi:hypothetical protein [Acinetobacter bouvetii]|uniref:hypothetical protein n=1 Tax=Acinetobacter bouvetii TaxID=202951 RepID=UPI0013EE4229|nr:hypothetical protein [Acinetobacter bouvetii]